VLALVQAIASLHNLLCCAALPCPALPRPALWAGQGGAGRGRAGQGGVGRGRGAQHSTTSCASWWRSSIATQHNFVMLGEPANAPA